MGQQQSNPGNNNPSSPLSSQVDNGAPSNSPIEQVSKCPITSKTASKDESSGCPMKFGKSKKEAISAPTTTSASTTSSAVSAQSNGLPAGECPVVYKNPNVYNVYNQKIDPTNQMPTQANQQPAPGQSSHLSTDREQSSIPKGGTDTTWLYPSPQMFWNALVRKEKLEGAIEEDIESVVRIHNSMNEVTWQKILQWEMLHPPAERGEGREPKLLRFIGRPDELSPKARLKTLMGHAIPFDRHDWIVDRGGVEVRYVIDYYHDEALASMDKTPSNKQDLHSVQSIKLDVRPALDSPSSLLDRILYMPYYRWAGKTPFQALPFFPESQTKQAEKQKIQMIKNFEMKIRETCIKEKEKLVNCKSEQECANASIALQACTGRVVCPMIAKEFDDSIKAQPFDDDKTEKAYVNLVKCLELFEIDARNALKK